MKDSFGRKLNYLRISVTDRCDLRCRYCMPECGVENIPHGEVLTYEETARIVRIMASLGVTKVRLTGGEPLLRKGITDLVRMISGTDGITETVMTTNGVMLSEKADDLIASGLKRVNISLDTLDRDVFRRLAGRDRLLDVTKGMDAAYSAGLGVKINCVPIRGINDTGLADIALISKDRAIDVRFIELMPIGCGAGLSGIPSGEVLSYLQERFGDFEPLQNDPASPAERFRFGGFTGSTGFISPMTHKFCDRCDRLRLTSDGFLKLCLQYPAGADLKTPIRAGCSDSELTDIILGAVSKKPSAHRFTEADMTDSRKMVQIGG